MSAVSRRQWALPPKRSTAATATRSSSRRPRVLLLGRCLVLDVVFLGVGVLFFVVSIGYVAACERLMK